MEPADSKEIKEPRISLEIAKKIATAAKKNEVLKKKLRQARNK